MTNGEVVEVRQAFGRNWVWPKADVWGWRGVMGQWPELATAITEEFPSGGAVALQAGGCCGMYPFAEPFPASAYVRARAA